VKRGLPDEPRGWRKLRDQAQRERNPKKLAALIEKMNRLLAKREAAEARKRSSASPKKP